MVRVRYDPWDASSAYVWLGDRWVRALCRSLVGLGQLTEVELQSISAEYTARFGTTLDEDERKQRLSEFMRIFKPEGVMAKKFEQQSENKTLLDEQGGGSVSPIGRMAKTPVYEDSGDDANELGTDMASQGGPPYGLEPASKGRSNAPLEWDSDLPDFGTF